MANTYTTNYNLAKPANGDVNWHTPVNENWDKIDTQLKENSDQIAAIGVPTGVIMVYSSDIIPFGWLECNGDAISRITYSTLFSIIGTTYGSGNGTTTFNLPDLRGEFIRGWDHGRGVDKNRIFGSTQEDEIKSHNHTLKYADDWPYGSGEAPQTIVSVHKYGELTKVIENTGGTETRPRNVALMYIIKT